MVGCADRSACYHAGDATAAIASTVGSTGTAPGAERAAGVRAAVGLAATAVRGAR